MFRTVLPSYNTKENHWYGSPLLRVAGRRDRKGVGGPLAVFFFERIQPAHIMAQFKRRAQTSAAPQTQHLTV